MVNKEKRQINREKKKNVIINLKNLFQIFNTERKNKESIIKNWKREEYFLKLIEARIASII